MRELLRFKEDLRVCIFDFETLNLSLSFLLNRPWQASVLKVVGSKEVDFLDLHIKWPNSELTISDEAARITKFNQEEFDKLAINEDIAFNQFYEWIENNDYVLGHNSIGFDLYLLVGWYKTHNKAWKHLIHKFIDTNCLAKAVKMNIPFKENDNLAEWQYKLYHRVGKGIKTNQLTLGKEWNLNFDENNLHNSLEDIRLTLQIFNKLKYMVEI